jgi:hypothetical protein
LCKQIFSVFRYQDNKCWKMGWNNYTHYLEWQIIRMNEANGKDKICWLIMWRMSFICSLFPQTISQW